MSSVPMLFGPASYRGETLTRQQIIELGKRIRLENRPGMSIRNQVKVMVAAVAAAGYGTGRLSEYLLKSAYSYYSETEKPEISETGKRPRLRGR